MTEAEADAMIDEMEKLSDEEYVAKWREIAKGNVKNTILMFPRQKARLHRISEQKK